MVEIENNKKIKHKRKKKDAIELTGFMRKMMEKNLELTSQSGHACLGTHSSDLIANHILAFSVQSKYAEVTAVFMFSNQIEVCFDIKTNLFFDE